MEGIFTERAVNYKREAPIEAESIFKSITEIFQDTNLKTKD